MAGDDGKSSSEQNADQKSALATAILNAKRRKNGFRQSVRQLMPTFERQIDDNADDQVLMLSVAKMEEYLSKLDGFDDQISFGLSESEGDTLMQDSMSFSEPARDLIRRANVLMSTRLRMSAPLSPHAGVSNILPQAPGQTLDGSPTVKLPKLDIKKYGGDPLSWREFWDSFRNTIHDNKRLSKIEKFKYLQQYLKGEALALAEGYPLSDMNYDVVVGALKERFGDEELAIFAHLDAMHTLPKATNEIDDIQRVIDKLEIHIRCLDTLGLSEANSGQFYTPLVLSKLPTYIRVEVYRRNGSRKWTLPDLRKHLREEIIARRMGKLALGESSSGSGKPGNGKPRQNWQNQPKGKPQGGTAAGLTASAKAKGKPGSARGGTGGAPKYPCIFCEGSDHYPDQCGEYPDLKSRLAAVQDSCQLCLKDNHSTQDCRQKYRTCPHCNAKASHHRSLCPDKFGSGVPTRKTAKPDPVCISTDAGLLGQAKSSTERVSVLPTALVLAKGKTGTERVRLLLDSGSTHSYGRSSLLRRVGAHKLGCENLALAGIEAKSRKVKSYERYKLQLLDESGQSVSVTLNSLTSITCPIEKQIVDPKKYPILDTIRLAEPLADQIEEVELDILIGLDYYYDIVGGRQIRLEPGLVLIDSKFGYILSGYVSGRPGEVSGFENSSELSLLAISGKDATGELRADLQRLWLLEEVGIKDSPFSTDDELAQQNFDESVTYDESELRYSVRWPFKSDCPQLPNNYLLAKGRLRSLLKRLDEPTFLKYDATIRDQWQKGIVEIAPEKPDGECVHYIPHHCVIREDKATTKLRVVYDASAKAKKSEHSLNECLYRGPVLLCDLCGLIMRFRLHAVGIVSDIEKAFLQVGLQQCQRDVTRFLWVRDPQKGTTPENLLVFRFARVLFGIISSPFLLAATIRHHLQKSDLPIAGNILRNIYVDNVITGSRSTESALEYYSESKQLFSTASMNLREWFSNSAQLMAAIPSHDRGSGTSTKVLGMVWDTIADTLRCSEISCIQPCSTKRQVLHHLARLYDPCGFFCPVSIRGKILLQDLWRLGCDWDEPMPDDLQTCWNNFAPDLSAVTSITVPRFLGLETTQGEHEFHCFCDASEKAYAVAVYLRTSWDDLASTNLLFAKARVSPLKNETLTIPKLELTALAVGCRVVKYVQSELVLSGKCFVWSDSKVALYWIQGKATSPRYVANRVNEIGKCDVNLRYVPTASNPADMPSRGMTLDRLRENDLWWHGPSFLRGPEQQWPATILGSPVDTDTAESPDATLVGTACVVPDSILDIQKVSTLRKLLRVTAWVFRFVICLRGKGSRAPISAFEIQSAKMYWVKHCQTDIADDLRSPRKSGIAKQLGLFVDDAGIVRCSGVLDNADLPFATKFPIFVSAKAHPHFAKLLVRNAHESLAHAGADHVVSELRQEFWIPRCKLEVKSVIRKCHICRKFKGGPFKPPSAPALPKFRISKQESFATVGIDYLGPLYIRNRDSTVKVWVCLFTCAITRAMHLEVVADLTANQFLMALRRFMSIYGRPDLIICDNAKNFHAAEKALKSVFLDICRAQQIQDASASLGITWKFIIELAPWMGGFYERMVGLVKSALKCAINNKKLDLIQLQTVCFEIAHILNSRPLTATDSVGNKALTPRDLLTMRGSNFSPLDTAMSEIPDGDYAEPSTQASLSMHYKCIEARLNSFWDKWHRDYLTSLRQQNREMSVRGCSEQVAKVGSVVLMKEKELPRSRWRIGLITELIVSADGNIRAAKVRTPERKIVQRPLKLLFPLEVPTNSADLETEVEGHDISQAEETSSPDHRAKNEQRRPAALAAQRKWREQLRQLDADETIDA